MACYNPTRGWYSAERSGAPLSGGGRQGPGNSRALVFKRELAFSGVPVRFPCGQCIGCRVERARQWAVRCMHESRTSWNSQFVTLTYEDGKVPDGGSLRKRDFQLFMKRLRKKHGAGVRFFACGEYGERTLRPHYHALLFNVAFEDGKHFRDTDAGNKLLTSQSLDDVWQNGYCYYGDVTYQSARYVAGYVVKKMTGDRAKEVYGDREPEFGLMSRRPGIGCEYYAKFGHEAFIHDNVIVDGKPQAVPRYYNVKFGFSDPERLAYLKKVRKWKALEAKEDSTPERLRVREHVVTMNLSATAKKDV